MKNWQILEWLKQKSFKIAAGANTEDIQVYHNKIRISWKSPYPVIQVK